MKIKAGGPANQDSRTPETVSGRKNPWQRITMALGESQQEVKAHVEDLSEGLLTDRLHLFLFLLL